MLDIYEEKIKSTALLWGKKIALHILLHSLRIIFYTQSILENIMVLSLLAAIWSHYRMLFSGNSAEN